jgi:hypothetical protein
MVWDGFRAIIRPCQVITVSDASKDTTPDAILTFNGNGEGDRI